MGGSWWLEVAALSLLAWLPTFLNSSKGLRHFTMYRLSRVLLLLVEETVSQFVGIGLTISLVLPTATGPLRSRLRSLANSKILSPMLGMQLVTISTFCSKSNRLKSIAYQPGVDGAHRNLLGLRRKTTRQMNVKRLAAELPPGSNHACAACNPRPICWSVSKGAFHNTSFLHN